MMRREIILTEEGYQRLKEELDYLKTVRRKDIRDRLRESLDFGEVGENPEYEELKREQAMVEGRIEELETILSLARVLDEESINTESVDIGSKVTVLDLDSQQTLQFKIVDPIEADPRRGYLSLESPVGAALLNRKRDEEVVVKVPAGTRRFKILDITR
ncbi:transcription elongation factor GreA [bacterium]|nr:transcription elongation factor GreA [bacterium]